MSTTTNNVLALVACFKGRPLWVKGKGQRGTTNAEPAKANQNDEGSCHLLLAAEPGKPRPIRLEQLIEAYYYQDSSKGRCFCPPDEQEDKKKSSDSKKKKETTTQCPSCRREVRTSILSWVRCISNKVDAFTILPPSPLSSEPTSPPVLELQVHLEAYARKIYPLATHLQVNGRRVLPDEPTDAKLTLHAGDVLTLQPPSTESPPATSQPSSLWEPMEFQVRVLSEFASQRDDNDKKLPAEAATDQGRSVSTTTPTRTTSTTATTMPTRTTSTTTATTNSSSRKRRRRATASETATEESSSEKRRRSPRLQRKTTPSKTNNSTAATLTLDQAPARAKGAVETQKTVAATAASTTDRDRPATSAATATKDKKFVLYLVPRGTMGTPDYLTGLRRNCEKRGARVLDTFDKNTPPLPTHLVISPEVQPATIAEELGFSSGVEELEDFLQEHNIVCATRAWAAYPHHAYASFRQPGMPEQYCGLNLRPRRKTSKTPPGAASAQPKMKQSSSVAPREFENNMRLADTFLQLSKLYKDCPLEEKDEWRSLSFSVASGRLRQLDFEITDDVDALKKLKNIKGIGKSQMDIVREFLTSGRVTRLEEFDNNPQRIAMKQMMDIWGVGRVKASELVQSGFENIQQVRTAVDEGTLTLDRNQYIGLLCYEDLQERMSRTEVEAIGEIVTKAVRAKRPSAEVTIMGSYRRGAPTCGDVDILIVQKSFFDLIPPRTLGEVVDELKSQGHILHHLTFISGMDHDRFESLPKDTASKLNNPRQYGRRHNKYDKFSSSSYMGVFNSPTNPGKHRRVDIKFYPYQERVFASLYFTGNGWFNRSMRLWATKQYDFTLNDHGLFKRGTTERVMEASSERDVFDRLGLAWREPNERLSYAACVSEEDGKVATVENLSRADLRSESEEQWID